MKYLLLFVTLFAMGFQGCNHNGPVPTPTEDAAAPSPSCATACARGAKLGCQYATPTPMGASCATVCENAAETVPWDIRGLTNATICK